MTRTRTLAIAAILFTATACTSTRNYWSGASVRDVSTLILYRMERKVLIFAVTPCAADDDKPAMVWAWVRESDIGKMVVVCDAECNCRLAKRTPSMKIAPTAESGICQ